MKLSNVARGLEVSAQAGASVSCCAKAISPAKLTMSRTNAPVMAIRLRTPTKVSPIQTDHRTSDIFLGCEMFMAAFKTISDLGQPLLRYAASEFIIPIDQGTTGAQTSVAVHYSFA